MRTQRVTFLVVLALIAGLLAGPGVSQQSKGDAADKEAIAKNAEAFIEAFHKGDAAALAAFWTPDGDYTTPAGHYLQGREAIDKAFQSFFEENKGLTLRIESHSLRFVTPEVAIEDGTSYLIHPDGVPPSRARYTIVHAKKDGKWMLSSVRDAPFTPPSNYRHLRALEWAVGAWSAENDQGEAQHLLVSWTDNQNFLTATFTASVKGVSVGQATHWVGWDPLAKRIRSWMFDATGGFGEGAWTKHENRWVVKTSSVQQDGKKATATFHIGRVDADTLTLQSTNRTVDNKPAPDTKEFKLKRVKEEALRTSKAARNLPTPDLEVSRR